MRLWHEPHQILGRIPHARGGGVVASFTEFWTAYPRKVGKAEAMVAYSKALRGALRRQMECGLPPATHDEIMAGLASYKRDKPDYADWKHGSTFLNKVSWIDEGGSDPVETVDPHEVDLEWKQKLHENGISIHPTLARQHGWKDAV